MNQLATVRRVAVIGGGITGLAAAHRLLELDPTTEITLFEASGRLGGVLQSVRQDGFLIEHSADSFITNVPWALDLCRRLGFEQDLIPTNSTNRQAQVVFRGRLHDVPAGFLLMAPTRIMPMLTTPLLSPWAKLRLLAEPLMPRAGSQDDESLASFVRRRLGREIFERLVQPLIAGIYTADPERLSLAATLPRFLAMERQYGSLVLAAARGAATAAADDGDRSSGARYSMFVAPRDGMSSLVNALARRLPPESVRVDAGVERIARAPNGSWLLTVAPAGASRGPTATEMVTADAVIVAVPAHRAAAMLAEADAELAELLTRIPYAGTAIVCTAFRRQSIGRPLKAFGFVVPARERRRILAASYSSVKFPGRAPDDSLLLRVFVGGACQAELARLDDAALERLVTEELTDLLDISGPPIFQQIARWPLAMPQYHVGHLRLVEAIEQRVARHAGLSLAGSAYRGVGIPHCVHSGENAAEAVIRTIPAPAAR